MAALAIDSAKPSRFLLPEGRTALVVIDMQKDFLLKNGYGYLQCPSEKVFEKVSSVIEPTAKAIAAARKLGLHVIHTREGHVPDLSDCPPSKRMRQATANKERHTLIIGSDGPMGRLLVRGSDGHDIVDEVKPLKDEPILDKPGKGSFYNTDFHQMLVSRGITHILLAGVTTECCVATTFREANDHGFECCVLTDCTGGFDDIIVSATKDHFCSFDGLLGYTATSKPLLDLAAAAPSIPPEIDDDSFILNMKSLRAGYKAGKVSPVEIISFIYDQISKSDVSYLFKEVIDKETALKSLGAPEKVGDLVDIPYFYGIPFTVSENFSKESSIVKTLLSQGAVLIGITKIEESGSGVLVSQSASVYNADYTAGGYNYASAIAVREGLCLFSLVLDTDGSARVPSAFNGIVGYNISKGLVSSTEVSKFCPSVDSISVLATTISDARSVFAESRGQNLSDPYSIPDRLIPIKSIDFRGPEGGFKFGIPDNLTLLSEEYKALFLAFIEKAKLMGGTEVTIDWSVYAQASKIFSSLLDVERQAFKKATATDPVAAKIQEAAASTVSSITPLKLIQDQDALRLLKTKLYRMFETAAGIDVIITPTVPYHPMIADTEKNAVSINNDLTIFTKLTNAFDMCALSVGIDTYGPLKLPFSVMFTAPMGMDARMLDIADFLK
ncbi:amidase signature domain-containing protein [Dipodascopsis uninucleata]